MSERYKAADIQIDVVFNKKGWHYPQQRLLTLWGDVKDTLAGHARPQPFFFRANSDADSSSSGTPTSSPTTTSSTTSRCARPTDIIGQHIHLVKFDVTSSDGAANGFNYEDGTFSPEEVREVIEAINKGGGLLHVVRPQRGDGRRSCTRRRSRISVPARTTRGSARRPRSSAGMPTRSSPTSGTDRTLRTIFTHDHFGPSTHQQVGLYAGLLVEPESSQWQDPVSGVFLGTDIGRPAGANGTPIDDGGPTGWQANIITADKKDSYREFALEFQDRQLAYKANSKSKAQFVGYKKYPTPTRRARRGGGPIRARGSTRRRSCRSRARRFRASSRSRSRPAPTR